MLIIPSHPEVSAEWQSGEPSLERTTGVVMLSLAEQQQNDALTRMRTRHTTLKNNMKDDPSFSVVWLNPNKNVKYPQEYK